MMFEILFKIASALCEKFINLLILRFVDDCVFVIEVGKMKEKRFDPSKNMESLDTIWVSKANALQRKGK